MDNQVHNKMFQQPGAVKNVAGRGHTRMQYPCTVRRMVREVKKLQFHNCTVWQIKKKIHYCPGPYNKLFGRAVQNKPFLRAVLKMQTLNFTKRHYNYNLKEGNAYKKKKQPIAILKYNSRSLVL